MRQKLGVLLVVTALIVGMAACGQESKEVKEKTSENQEETTAQKEETTKQKEDEQPPATEENAAQTEEQEPATEQEPSAGETTKITVYYSNQDATDFEKADVDIAELSPEAVLSELIGKGALPADVSVNKFEETVVDGKKSIELDLSGKYATYITGQGTAGEWISIGSICNTFLKAYGCERIHITVDGGMLKTGHAEYPGYLSEFVPS
ncbi:GerMN domain-containing protein [Hespellia stercorisuis]|uniref:Sporulation and spore germination n=1 Tax=Hespellia stercorisuis DSM 15480 TaxID=1121950 RepID=A0A1M6Q6D9_9FIRM|nr:GerMN domain-containing protein [Hespellia stercorisuis]SHK15666.1 Sporulation and spore germination [Hespellia stercorisuis DSM 15480]